MHGFYLFVLLLNLSKKDESNPDNRMITFHGSNIRQNSSKIYSSCLTIYKVLLDQFLTFLLPRRKVYSSVIALYCQQKAYPVDMAGPSPLPILHECCSVGVRNDPSLLFFGWGKRVWGGGGGVGESICSCQCFQERYQETRHGNVNFS